MTRFVQILLAFLFAALPSMAQNNIDGFVARVHKTMPYRLFTPKGYDKEKKYPLVLWLHGAGSVGTDNKKQISQASTLGTHVWTRAEIQAKHSAFVLAPQSPVSSWSSQLDLVLEILDSLRREFNIDPQRMYVAGQSMGGYGTWELITKKPDLFAGAIPLCGGGSTAAARLISRMPIWAFHGAVDNTVPVQQSRDMIDAIKRAGGNPRYTEYPRVGHDVWERAFKEPGLIDWFFAQHR